MTGFLAPDESECACEMRARKELEDQYEWLKDCMCMYHWMQTDHYRAKGEKCILCDAPNTECECGVAVKNEENI